jgi:hypothetical protein
MEAALITEGFLKIEKLGARIKEFMADADASTFPTL